MKEEIPDKPTITKTESRGLLVRRAAGAQAKLKILSEKDKTSPVSKPPPLNFAKLMEEALRANGMSNWQRTESARRREMQRQMQHQQLNTSIISDTDEKVNCNSGEHPYENTRRTGTAIKPRRSVRLTSNHHGTPMKADSMTRDRNNQKLLFGHLSTKLLPKSIIKRGANSPDLNSPNRRTPKDLSIDAGEETHPAVIEPKINNLIITRQSPVPLKLVMVGASVKSMMSNKNSQTKNSLNNQRGPLDDSKSQTSEESIDVKRQRLQGVQSSMKIIVRSNKKVATVSEQQQARKIRIAPRKLMHIEGASPVSIYQDRAELSTKLDELQTSPWSPYQ